MRSVLGLVAAALAAIAVFGVARGGAALVLCGGAPSQRTYEHVIWIFLENQSYERIIGPAGSSASAESPYVNRTLVPACGLATNFHNVTHPSIPNYLAVTSGSTHGLTTPCQPDECPIAGPNLFSQIRSAGRSWRAYMQSMPQPCDPVEKGFYAADHNPPVYYPSIRSDCEKFDLRLAPFATALKTNRLPAFSYVKPDTCHDGDDCTVANGDTWLATWVPRITKTPAYRAGQVVLFISWDEGAPARATDCTTAPDEPGCHIPTLVVSRAVRGGTRSGLFFDHYGLLKTTEQLLGLKGFLGHAGDAATNSLRTAFKL
jgi:hypothetical protein